MPDGAPPPSRQMFERIVAADFGAGASADRDALDIMVTRDASAQADHDDVMLLWQMLGDLPDPDGDAPGLATTVTPFRQRLRAGVAGRAARIAIAGAATALVLAVGVGVIDGPSGAARAFVVETGKAERRVAELPDGSTVELSGDSRILVRFRDGRRIVRLERGEALMRIARNDAPLVIEAGSGEIRGTGALNVKIVRGDVQVTTIAGSADLSVGSAAAGRLQSATLADGEQLTFGTRAGVAPGSTMMAPRQVDVAGTLDWTRGQLEFRGEPLRDVVDEVNRHSAGRVVLLDPSEADTPIYGVLRIGDLRGLSSILEDRQLARGRTAQIVRIDGAVD